MGIVLAAISSVRKSVAVFASAGSKQKKLRTKWDYDFQNYTTNFLLSIIVVLVVPVG